MPSSSVSMLWYKRMLSSSSGSMLRYKRMPSSSSSGSMLWYKRARSAFDGLHNFALRIPHNNNQIQGSIFVRAIHSYLNHRKGNFGAIFFRRVPNLNHRFLNNNQANYLIQNGARRFYGIVKSQGYHSRSRWFMNWFKAPRNKFIALAIGSGIVVTMCLGSLETVPYTRRKHVVLSSKSFERELGEDVFNDMKDESKGKLLAENHPDSVRVRLISKKIIESLQKGMKKDDNLKALSHEMISGRRWNERDSFLYDKSREKIIKRVRTSLKKGSLGHLEGMNWEFVVVDQHLVNACCLPGGKIIVYTGLLEYFKSDAEIATIIGHEVAHALARHCMENLIKVVWLTIVSLVLSVFIDQPELVNKITKYLLTLPFSRRMEMEADYVGLMLMASAGYDPRRAPEVYEKLGKAAGEEDMGYFKYFSTHPSSKKRAQTLAKAKVMEKALVLYEEFQAERRAQRDVE